MVSNEIITKWRHKKEQIFLLSILLYAALLRLYHIRSFTEFLGDQGRTALALFQAWQLKSFPVVGPPVLTGQHLGPAFYYIIGLPFLLSGFNPVASAVTVALLGVCAIYVFYRVSTLLFDTRVSLWLTLLYAVSPKIVNADRTVWEPNVIPLFILVYLYSILKIYERQSVKYFLLLGLSIGILVQLHYPNVFYVVLSGALYLHLLIAKRKIFWKMVAYIVLSVGVFVLTLFPFLTFEFTHGFKDVREIILIMISSGSAQTGTPFLYRVIDYSFRLFSYVIPASLSLGMTLVHLAVIAIIFFKRTSRSMLFFSWYAVGLLAMGLYGGTVYDHYLNFLLPLPFLFLGFIFVWLRQLRQQFWLPMVAILLIVFNLKGFDVATKEVKDIERTKRFTEEIIKRAKGEAFSFTLTSSRSFSDLHYRYFFMRNLAVPMNITSNDYRTLFLVCEKTPCPSYEQMSRAPSVDVMCSDPHCEGVYPKLNLGVFRWSDSWEDQMGRIYMYKR